MPAILIAVWQVLWGFASSHLGNVVIAAMIAFLWGGHRAHVACRDEAENVQTKLERAFWTEVERQRQVAKDLENKARQREGEDAVRARAMQVKIDEYAKKESQDVPSKSKVPSSSRGAPAASRSCAVDRDFARVVRSLDAAGRHRSAPPR